MHAIHTALLQALKRKPVSSGFSADGSLICASAVPHCGIDLKNSAEDKTESSGGAE